MRRFFALIICVAALAACATTTPPPPMKVRVAVLDFLPPSAQFYSPDFKAKQRRGWWMGGRDLYQYPHVGVQMADVLSHRLSRAETITTYLREDLRQYVADKLDQLRKAYPNLNDAQLAELADKSLSENAMNIGQELHVDWVVTGHILKAAMGHNRTVHSWGSGITLELAIWDVEKGEKIYAQRFSESEMFSSLQSTMDVLADKIAKAIARKFGHR